MNERDGVLILSENAGAYGELKRSRAGGQPVRHPGAGRRHLRRADDARRRAPHAHRGHPRAGARARHQALDRRAHGRPGPRPPRRWSGERRRPGAVVRAGSTDPAWRRGRPRSPRRSGSRAPPTVELDLEAAAGGCARRRAARHPRERSPAPGRSRSRCSASARSRRRSSPACAPAHPDLVLVWVDAHGDLNTPETSRAASWAGCRSPCCSAGATTAAAAPPGSTRALPEARAALVGARDLDPGERGGDRALRAGRRPTTWPAALGGAAGGRADAPAPGRRRARSGRRARRRLPRPGRLERRAARSTRWRRSPRTGRVVGRERVLRQPPPRPRRPRRPGVRPAPCSRCASRGQSPLDCRP